MRIRRQGEQRRALGRRGERMNAPKSRPGGGSGGGGGLLGGLGGGGRGGGRSGGGGIPMGNLGKGGGVMGIIIALVVAFLAMRGGGGTVGTTGSGTGNDVVGERTELVSVQATSRSSLSAAERADLDAFLTDAVDDLAVYWTEEYPQVYGGRFQPLNAVFPFDPTGDQRISCGQPLDSRILNSNAIYCPAEDYITWDSNFLIPNFYANFGKSSVGVVLAHEYGHAVQTRGGFDGAPILRDLQADCFAGAWIGRSIRGEGAVQMAPRDLTGAVSGFLLLRDPPGAPTDGFSAHGSAFDRVNAFQSGYDEGPERCRDFATEGVEIVDLNIERGDVNGGNLDYPTARDAVIEDLNVFWSGITGASGPQLSWNEEELAARNADIGDFATGFTLARLHGEAVLDELGIADRDGSIAVCLAGVWAGDVAYTSTRPLELTGGDLDEAIATMLDDPEAGDVSAFDRVASFKTGFFDGGSGTVASVEICR